MTLAGKRDHELVGEVFRSVHERGFHGLGAWDETVRICQERLRAAGTTYKRFMHAGGDLREGRRLRGEVERWKRALKVAEMSRRYHLRIRLAAIEEQLKGTPAPGDHKRGKSPDED